MPESVYVDVVVLMNRQGEMTPLFIIWNNGIKYRIDKSLKKGQRRCPSGGNGLLYLIKIEGKQRRLFYDRLKNAWFIEKQ